MLDKVKYPNGYLPKIAFHMADNNPEAVEHFTERHEARFGYISPEDLKWVCKRAAAIKREWEQEMKEFNSHLSVNRF